MGHLFEPFKIRGVTLRNRIAVSPMCQYSCEDGLANDWHFVHLGSRAVGGAAIVFCEATAVTPEARISPEDLGIWSDRHAEALARIVRFVHEQGSLAGIQLAHAGRKASTYRTWSPKQGVVPASEGGWTNVLAPSAIKFQDDYPQPREITQRRNSRRGEGVWCGNAAGTRCRVRHCGNSRRARIFDSRISFAIQ